MLHQTQESRCNITNYIDALKNLKCHINVRYVKIQIIPSNAFAYDLYRAERQKMWSGNSQS